MRTRLLRLFGHEDWIEDALQSAFETFLRKRHQYRGEGSIEAFAQAIALNTARDWMRRQSRSILLHELVADRGAWPPIDPSEQAEHTDRIRRLGLVLARIGPRYRMPYLLYHVENMPVAEIARIEGATEAAIRKRLSRAREQIHARAMHDPVLAEWLEARRKEG
jgi:RNA polymerase sigma factor (sigma-70 family)